MLKVLNVLDFECIKETLCEIKDRKETDFATKTVYMSKVFAEKSPFSFICIMLSW